MLRKCQMAIEYTLLMGIALFGVMLLLVFVYSVNADKNAEKIDAKLDDFSYSLQNEIILASVMNDGYNRPLYIPQDLENLNYSISNTNDTLIIFSDNRNIYLKIPLVNGTIVKGNNILKKISGHVEIIN